MTSIVDGRSFRSGVERIAHTVGVNVCISRDVDPSRIIDSGPLGPTAYLALRKLAVDHGCVVMPVRSVVLIGKEDWVDCVTVLLRGQPTSKRVDVAWPRLTTPSEAIDAVAKTDSTAMIVTDPEPLLHDLWPAVTWTEIESSVAMSLVLSLIESESVLPDIKGARAKKQRLKLDRTLVKAAEKLKNVDPLDSTFSLTTQTRVADVLGQLCAAAGRRCVIEPTATQACNKVVSISEKDVTLRHLIETVADKVGVLTRWETNRVVFELPE